MREMNFRDRLKQAVRLGLVLAGPFAGLALLAKIVAPDQFSDRELYGTLFFSIAAFFYIVILVGIGVYFLEPLATKIEDKIRQIVKKMKRSK